MIARNIYKTSNNPGHTLQVMCKHLLTIQTDRSY